MDWSGIGQAATGVAALIGAIGAIVNGRKANKAQVTADHTQHLVNSQHDALVAKGVVQDDRVEQLSDTLRQAGQDVPPKPKEAKP